MNTRDALIIKQIADIKGASYMVFDWIKAVKMIKEKKAQVVYAGLQGDWEYTGGKILENGKPVPEEDTYVFLCSNWAVPEILIDGAFHPCWILKEEKPEWDSKTYWPEEALKLLNKE